MKIHPIKSFLILALLAFLFSCNRKKENKNEHFKIPIIRQHSIMQKIQHINTDSMISTCPSFEGKFSFADTIHLSGNDNKDNNLSKDMVPYALLMSTDTISSCGFEIFTDYKTDVYLYNFTVKEGNYNYPVYAVNQTPRNLFFTGKDNHVFAIQEAIDSMGQWRPIEFMFNDFCGVGNFGLIVRPNEYVCFLIPKYKGSYSTKLRVRVEIGNSIYVSSPFKGTINYGQFFYKKNQFPDYNIENYKTNTVLHYFLGSIPIQALPSRFHPTTEKK